MRVFGAAAEARLARAQGVDPQAYVFYTRGNEYLGNEEQDA